MWYPLVIERRGVLIDSMPILNCCECGTDICEVMDDTYGYICTSSMCDECDAVYLEEISEG